MLVATMLVWLYIYSFVCLSRPKSYYIIATLSHSLSYVTFLVTITILLALLNGIGPRTPHISLLFYIALIYPFYVLLFESLPT